MEIIKNIWHKAAPKLIHPVDSYKTWHFQKTDLGYLFADKHRILVHAEPGLTIPSMQHLLKSMEINTVGHAKLLASLLNKLRIREVLVEKDVDWTMAIIKRHKLMNALHQYINEDRIFNRMVIKRLILDVNWLDQIKVRADEKDLIVAQSVHWDKQAADRQLTEIIIKCVHAGMAEEENITIVETVSPEALTYYTTHPGESVPAIADESKILTLVPHPETRKPLLDPEVYENMSRQQREILDEPKVEALKQFKKLYMFIDEPDGDLGPRESMRLATYNVGHMLTYIIDPETQELYLKPKVFNAMLPHHKVQLGYGKPNSIYLALKRFAERYLPDKAHTMTPFDALKGGMYNLVIEHFEKWLAGT